MPDSKCPVDSKSASAWLNGGEGCPVDHKAMAAASDEACGSDRIDKNSSLHKGQTDTNTGLSLEREVSTIPRGGSDSNWVYPSQKQFFDAMKRKKFDPEAKDMQSIIPIHNAVNERAWMEILKWEDGQGGQQCGGPKLMRFKGDSTKTTPRAWWNALWGMQKPFDRHDWTVDRCGTEVEYVIDFYTGKPNPLVPEMPSFYLDARPKLNSVEGVRLRVFKFLGF